MRRSGTHTATLDDQWIQLRERLIAGCELEHVGPLDPDRLHARVRVYFGEAHDPAPVLDVSRVEVVRYLRQQTRPAPLGAGEDLAFAVAVLNTNLDEEFDTDHGDERRLRTIGLRGERGRVIFFAEVS